MMIDLAAIKEHQQKARQLLARKQGRVISDATFAVALIELERDVSDLVIEVETVTTRCNTLLVAGKVILRFVWAIYSDSGKDPFDPAKQVWLDFKHAIEEATVSSKEGE